MALKFANDANDSAKENVWTVTYNLSTNELTWNSHKSILFEIEDGEDIPAS